MFCPFKFCWFFTIFFICQDVWSERTGEVYGFRFLRLLRQTFSTLPTFFRLVFVRFYAFCCHSFVLLFLREYLFCLHSSPGPFCSCSNVHSLHGLWLGPTQVRAGTPWRLWFLLALHWLSLLFSLQPPTPSPPHSPSKNMSNYCCLIRSF